MFQSVTGSKQVLVRNGFSDYDAYGSGNFAMAATGNLDAPNFIPNGSVRISNTIKHAPHLSLQSRLKEVGEQDDGPEAVPATLYPDMCMPRESPTMHRLMPARNEWERESGRRKGE